ncbi:MAG: glutaredoxin 3 [Colwellia sp.]
MTKIEIYTKSYCPFCTKAMALLKQKVAGAPSLQLKIISIDGDKDLRAKMIARSHGAYTVPQIFIDNVHVGDCDQLFALDRQNKLDALLTS